jgi:hypothetical protein
MIGYDHPDYLESSPSATRERKKGTKYPPVDRRDTKAREISIDSDPVSVKVGDLSKVQTELLRQTLDVFRPGMEIEVTSTLVIGVVKKVTQKGVHVILPGGKIRCFSPLEIAPYQSVGCVRSIQGPIAFTDEILLD